MENSVTLSCGHQYCLKCIQAYGKAPLSELQYFKRIDECCLICRCLLCGELFSEEFNIQHLSGRIRCGTGRHETSDQIRGPWGRNHLTEEEQLRFECRYLTGKAADWTNDELLKSIQKVVGNGSKMGSMDTAIQEETVSVDMNINLRVELSTGLTKMVTKNTIYPSLHQLWWRVFLSWKNNFSRQLC